MTDVREFETYLYIRNDKFKIFLLDTSNLNNIYSNELILDNNSRINFEELSRFLDNNIFKIEKLLGKFIEDILLIIDDDVELQTIISIKKRNNNLPEKKILNQALIDSKDLFKENNEDKDIIHMIIENFMIDGKDCNFLSENLKSDYPALRIKINLGLESLSSQFKKADKSGASIAIIIGEEELEKKMFSLKNLRSKSDQEMLNIEELSDKLQDFYK